MAELGAKEIIGSREYHLGRLKAAIGDAREKRKQADIASFGARKDGTIRSHTFTGWIGVDDDLHAVTWFSAGARLHSRNIAQPLAVNNGASYISGGFSKTQEVSKPVVGVLFEARGSLVEGNSRRAQIIEHWIERGLFGREEVEGYLVSEKPGVPPHGVYEGIITQWQLMDSTHPEEPRVVLLDDDECEQLLPREPTFGAHEHNPHLHLPLWDLSRVAY